MAVAAVDAGWPVVPGAWWSPAAGQFVCDVPGCSRSGLHPALLPAPGAAGPVTEAEPGGLVVDALVTRAAVVDRWRHQPYAVLVPTGVACDAVEVPAALGRWLAAALESQGRLGPVLDTGTRWTLFTTPAVGEVRVDGFAGHALVGAGILHHGLGSWVALPPSRRPGGEPATWVRPPQASGWALPDHHEVTRLLDVVRERRPMGVPAQSTATRGRRPLPRIGDDLVAMMS